MTDTVLDIHNLQVQFFTEEKTINAVDDISFQLNRGQILGIVGESGSGKSVTSLAIMRLISHPGKISQGEIWFHHLNTQQPVNLLALNKEEIRHYRGGKIAMIFQEPMSALNPVYDIGFQITEAILLHQNISKAEAKRIAIARLQEVQLLPSDQQLREQYLAESTRISPNEAEVNQYINQQKQAILKRYPHQLSGGQLQRVMIAMAISCNPEVLIADEPTTALDVTIQATILSLLRELCRQRGMSMIFITHDLGVISQLCDAVVVMYQGKIVEYESVDKILHQPLHPYTKGLLACRPRLEKQLSYLPTVADFMNVETTKDGNLIIKEKAGYIAPKEVTITEIQQRLSKLHSASPLIRVQHLQVGFSQGGLWGKPKRYFMAVDDVSFDVYPGETLGLVGESGCGKSTLARTILRLIPPKRGDIFFHNENLAKLAMGDQRLRSLRRQMQIVFQNPYSALNPRMSVGRAIAEPMLIHNTVSNIQKRRERVAYLLERVGLNPNWMNRYPHEFSGGQRQRICIARALALNPQFIICDESVSALDVSVQAQVLNLLKELQQEMGLTYIFISHDLSVVKFMSDRIMVMNRGKIEEIGTAEQIYRQPQREYTRQLIAAIPK